MSIRPVRPDDYPDVNRLHRQVWWPERSMAGWRWLADNPARLDLNAPEGWVIEDGEGRAAAFLGNLPQRFYLTDRRLHAATGFSIIVPPEQRGGSRALIKAFMDQAGCFARYTLNANPRSSGLYHRHGMKAWPPLTHDLKLSWIVDPLACLQGRLLRGAVARFPSLAAMLGETFMNRRLWGESRRRTPDRVRPLGDLSDGSAYDSFWRALRAEGRLVADRSPAVLRWRLSDPDRTHEPVMLVHEAKDGITGFAMAQLAKGNSIEPAFLEIVDLVALEHAPEALPALTAGLIATARAMGAAKVRLQVVNPHLLSRLGGLARSARREGGWGHCHVIFDQDADFADDWRPTPYDGDYGVCLRPVPAPAPAMLDRRAPWRHPAMSKA